MAQSGSSLWASRKERCASAWLNPKARMSPWLNQACTFGTFELIGTFSLPRLENSTGFSLNAGCGGTERNGDVSVFRGTKGGLDGDGWNCAISVLCATWMSSRIIGGCLPSARPQKAPGC